MVGESGEMVEADIPASAVVGVVTGEYFHLRADRDLKDVASSRCVDF